MSGATGSTYAVQAADVGKTLTVKVTGTKTGYTTASAESADAEVAAGVITPGTVTVAGTVQVGQTVTVVPGSWSPADVALAYQWQLDGVAVSGATGSTYAVQAGDAGKTLTVTVTGTKAGYTTASAESAGTEVAAGVITPGTVTVAGTAQVGQTVTAQAGSWSPADVTLSYQWQLDGTAVSGATGSTYAVQAGDAGKTLTVKVTGTKTGYATAAATSAGAVVAAGVITPGTPVISGTVQVGQTVTVVPGSWSPADVQLSYQWQVDGVAVSGAVTSSYAVKAEDQGKTLTVTVTGLKAGYTTASAESAGAAVAAGVITPGTPLVTGTVQVGQTVTGVPGVWSPA
ncbi:MAG: hypothetical protein LBR19_04780, partial [Bifidobacteriaceae bacterium]|nr:hypothetical protein [Bifidobacteriaceae bacterium]